MLTELSSEKFEWFGPSPSAHLPSKARPERARRPHLPHPALEPGAPAPDRLAVCGAVPSPGSRDLGELAFHADERLADDRSRPRDRALQRAG